MPLIVQPNFFEYLDPLWTADIPACVPDVPVERLPITSCLDFMGGLRLVNGHMVVLLPSSKWLLSLVTGKSVGLDWTRPGNGHRLRFQKTKARHSSRINRIGSERKPMRSGGWSCGCFCSSVVTGDATAVPLRAHKALFFPSNFAVDLSSHLERSLSF